MSIINDDTICTDLLNIATRNEQQTNTDKLVKSFYDNEMMSYVKNINHQVIQGRKGTGKTHLFRVLNQKLKKEENSISIYIDCRTFGSASSIADSNATLDYRCKQLFKDLAYCVLEGLLKHFSPNYFLENDYNQQIIEMALNELSVSLITPNVNITDNSKKTVICSVCEDNSEFGVKISAFPEASGKFNRNHNLIMTTENEYTEQFKDTIVFPNINGNMQRILETAESRLYILIDEWSSLPLEIQPYFAEYLRRCYTACPRITVKIAVIEHRNCMCTFTNNERMGLEIGSDISLALNLDQLFVFDNTPKKVINFMLNILLKHICAEVDSSYLQYHYGINSSNCSELTKYIFQDDVTMYYLVKAAEGNARDLINIFTNCVRKCRMERKELVDYSDVLEETKNWFNMDKFSAIDSRLKLLFDEIVAIVVEKNETRGFFIRQEALSNNKYLLDLIDSRLLHYLSSGQKISGIDTRRYTVLLIDHGACADYLIMEKCVDLFKNDFYEQKVRLYNVVKFKRPNLYQNYYQNRQIRNVNLTETINRYCANFN